MDRSLVRLKILSPSLSPAEISSLVGLESTKSWRAGELRPKTTIKESSNGWILECGESEAASLETKVAAFLDRLLPVAERIEALSESNAVEFSCVIYCKETPALNFDRKVIRQIAALGATLDIDLYLL